MTIHYDPGIVLKLYLEEPESTAVREFVTQRGERIHLSDFHMAECRSALRLKQFRGECGGVEVAQILAGMEWDFRSGVLRALAIDWDLAWRRCSEL